MGEIEIHDYAHLKGTLRTLEQATHYGLHDNVSVYFPSASLPQLAELSLRMQKANAAESHGPWRNLRAEYHEDFSKVLIHSIYLKFGLIPEKGGCFVWPASAADVPQKNIAHLRKMLLLVRKSGLEARIVSGAAVGGKCQVWHFNRPDGKA